MKGLHYNFDAFFLLVFALTKTCRKIFSFYTIKTYYIAINVATGITTTNTQSKALKLSADFSLF